LVGWSLHAVAAFLTMPLASGRVDDSTAFAAWHGVGTSKGAGGTLLPLPIAGNAIGVAQAALTLADHWLCD